MQLRWLGGPRSTGSPAARALCRCRTGSSSTWPIRRSRSLIAAAIGLPLGFSIGHTGRGRQLVIGFTGAMRALPDAGRAVLSHHGAGLRACTTTPAVLIGVDHRLRDPGGAVDPRRRLRRRRVGGPRGRRRCAGAVGMTECADPRCRIEIPLGSAGDRRRPALGGPADHRHRHHRVLRRARGSGAHHLSPASASTTTTSSSAAHSSSPFSPSSSTVFSPSSNGLPAPRVPTPPTSFHPPPLATPVGCRHGAHRS